jgi:hypothetical protein
MVIRIRLKIIVLIITLNCTALGYNNYNQYCQTVKIDRDEDDILFSQDAGIVSDDEDDSRVWTLLPCTHPNPIPNDDDRPWTEANTPQTFEVTNPTLSAQITLNNNQNDDENSKEL